MRILSAAFLICFLALTSRSVNALTVSISTISRTSFCSGDSIAVSFTVTGFFGHRNAFTLQLSDPTGSFLNFQNIASLVDTLPGTFTINWTIPASTTPSRHYRFRILAAIPYVTSADNGSDIAIWTRPTVGSDPNLNFGSTGTPITFATGADSNETAYWDFGSGATPPTAITPATVDPKDYFNNLYFTQDVTYSTPGDKAVTLSIVNAGGCSSTTETFERLHIYDCSNPSIPHDAIVINSDTTINLGPLEPSRTYWVNPGVSLNLPWGSGHDSIFTIFAEPGSTISGAVYCILYMKHGSVFSTSGGRNSVIFGDGTSINVASNNFTLHCPTLDFDYTNAPPNAAHPLDGVVNTSLPSVTISPNPTRGIISIQGAPSNDLNVSVMNLLGETVMELKNLNSPDFTLDLSKLVPGTYYIRFSSANSVVTKKIIKN